jgi:hypothetical protein
MEQEKKTSNPSSMRLSDEAVRLRKALAEKKGISQRAVMELALRDMAKKEGIK